MRLKVTITDHSPTRGPTTTDVIMDGDQVRCSDPPLLEFLSKHGAVGEGGKTFKPADGRAFMEALRFQFSGSYARASAPVEF